MYVRFMITDPLLHIHNGLYWTMVVLMRVRTTFKTSGVEIKLIPNVNIKSLPNKLEGQTSEDCPINSVNSVAPI